MTSFFIHAVHGVYIKLQSILTKSTFKRIDFELKRQSYFFRDIFYIENGFNSLVLFGLRKLFGFKNNEKEMGVYLFFNGISYK